MDPLPSLPKVLTPDRPVPPTASTGMGHPQRQASSPLAGSAHRRAPAAAAHPAGGRRCRLTEGPDGAVLQAPPLAVLRGLRLLLVDADGSLREATTFGERAVVPRELPGAVLQWTFEAPDATHCRLGSRLFLAPDEGPDTPLRWRATGPLLVAGRAGVECALLLSGADEVRWLPTGEGFEGRADGEGVDVAAGGVLHPGDSLRLRFAVRARRDPPLVDILAALGDPASQLSSWRAAAARQAATGLQVTPADAGGILEGAWRAIDASRLRLGGAGAPAVPVAAASDSEPTFDVAYTFVAGLAALALGDPGPAEDALRFLTETAPAWSTGAHSRGGAGPLPGVGGHDGDALADALLVLLGGRLLAWTGTRALLEDAWREVLAAGHRLASLSPPHEGGGAPPASFGLGALHLLERSVRARALETFSVTARELGRREALPPATLSSTAPSPPFDPDPDAGRARSAATTAPAALAAALLWPPATEPARSGLAEVGRRAGLGARSREALGAWVAFAVGAPERGWRLWRRAAGLGGPEAGPRPDVQSGVFGTSAAGEPWTEALLALAIVHGALGVEPDAARGRLTLAPTLPPSCSGLEVTGLRVGDVAVDMAFEAARGRHRFHLRPRTGATPLRLVLSPWVPGPVRATLVDGHPATLDAVPGAGGFRVAVQLALDSPRLLEVVTHR